MRCALLHGFAGTPAAWNDVIAAWQLPEPPLAIALPGHRGVPVAPTWDDNLAAVAQAIAGCDVVVGYSLGARVVLGLVATKRCARGVLISVNPGIDVDDRAHRRIADARWAAVLRQGGVAVFDKVWSAQPLFASQSRVDMAKRRARTEARLTNDAEGLARSLEVMGLASMPDYRPVIDTLPVALIAGEDDSKFVALAQATQRPLELLAGSGHDPTLEQPERLAAAIARAVVRLA